MARRLALQGTSEEETNLLHDLLDQVAPTLRAAWKLHAGDDADLLIIDVDSVYGHMDWLRAHGNGKLVATLSAQPHEESSLVLRKPVTLTNLSDVLERAVALTPNRIEPAPLRAAPKPQTAAKPTAVAAPPPPVSTEPLEPDAPVEPPRERRLAQWLADGALSTPVRLQMQDGPELVLDPPSQTFYAETSLRALAPCCAHSIAPAQWHSVGVDELAKVQANGKAQPLMRLVWLSHALGWSGHPAPGMDVNAKYKLSRWPQIEREFPKHFRIATVMMKQAATLSEVAEQSGATLPDVIDFTNAYHAIGYVAMEDVQTVQRDSGRGAILSRLRKPFGGGTA